ncbi:hypothetical protein BGZ94_007785 [Podila epigama]|nr:hypothetical protein BGZ94_007785 [Podila epigama]
MDDLYQFMTPIQSTAPKSPATTEDDSANATDSSRNETASSSSVITAGPRASWSSWGASFNKFIERGKKDMNEFVDVTRKDLNELVLTVQAESSTTMTTLSKRVEDLKKSTTLPASVSAVVEGIKHEITEAATGVSLTTQQQTTPAPTTVPTSPSAPLSQEEVASQDKAHTTLKNHKEEDAEAHATADMTETGTSSATTPDTQASATREAPRAEKNTLSFASTASLFTAGASSLTQTLTSSTKDISSSANQLFKKTLPVAAEKLHFADADQFLKNTTESLKTNGLLAEQYVNKFGAGMANFINNAVVISAPSETKDTTSRSKKMLFDRKAAMLEQLRLDPATYTVDPMTTIADNDIVGLERYKYFLQTFNMAEYQQRIARLLNEYPEVKTLMHKLVPLEVADEELFWLRYYFRLYELEEEEKRRKKLVQEAGNDLAEEDFAWDDEEDESSENAALEHGSVTPKAEKAAVDSSTTPKGSQALRASTTLTPEALASSLSALPVPSASDATGDHNRASDSEDEWGNESPKLVAKSTPSTSATVATTTGGATATGSSAGGMLTVTKSPTSMSSTRTSEDSYAVVDGTETPVRMATQSVQSMTSAASSPKVAEQSQQTKPKIESKDEDDWSDWE